MYLKTALARKSHRKRKRRIYRKICVKDEGVYQSCIKEVSYKHRGNDVKRGNKARNVESEGFLFQNK